MVKSTAVMRMEGLLLEARRGQHNALEDRAKAERQVRDLSRELERWKDRALRAEAELKSNPA